VIATVPGSGMFHLLEKSVARALIFVIRAYQSLHVAFFRGSCRFHPTCSHYALEAIEIHGPARGTLLTAWRVLRCQPFCRGGFDPVPEPKQKQTGQLERAMQETVGATHESPSTVVESRRSQQVPQWRLS
jgi:putative membrane protein insertion efficiency factor